jgi:hypothetical protein
MANEAALHCLLYRYMRRRRVDETYIVLAPSTLTWKFVASRPNATGVGSLRAFRENSSLVGFTLSLRPFMSTIGE